MDNCIFCKIVKGEIPSYRVYEDDDILAMLDINPFSKGHLLVLPKEHFENIYDIPTELFSKLMTKSKKIAEVLKEKLNPEGMILQQNSGEKAGQSVHHIHIHLKPVYKDTDIPAEKHLRQELTQEELQEIHSLLLLEEL